MDSIKETIAKTLQDQKISLSFLDEEERFPCPHGTMVRRDSEKYGSKLRLCECGKCEKEKEDREEEARKINLEKARFNDFIWDSGSGRTSIPKRFINKTLDNFNASSKEQNQILNVCRKFTKNFEEAKNNGTSLVFCGKPGTGKTHLAYAMVSILRESFVIAMMTTASDMTAMIKDAYKSDETNPYEVTAMYANYDFLVIDEVGVQVSSEAEKRIFFDVINKRYENMLPTLLISNLERVELTKFVGERVMDRMNENGGAVFAFDWKSNR